MKKNHIVTLQRCYNSQIFKSRDENGLVKSHLSSKLVIAQISNTNHAQYFYKDS